MIESGWVKFGLLCAGLTKSNLGLVGGWWISKGLLAPAEPYKIVHYNFILFWEGEPRIRFLGRRLGCAVAVVMVDYQGTQSFA